MSSLRLEVHDIPKYGGGRGEDVDAWVFRLEELYILNAIQDEEFRIKYAGQHLAGKAATWYRSRRVATASHRITTWDEFKTGIKLQFQPFNLETEAKEKLFRLDQASCGKGALWDYMEKFLHLTTIVTDMREKDLLCIYLAGLTGKIKVEMKLRNPN